MARTKSTVVNSHSATTKSLLVPEKDTEIKNESTMRVCPHCEKIFDDLYDADIDEHIAQCSTSDVAAPITAPAIASGDSSPLSAFSRSPSPVSEVPVTQATDVNDDEDSLISSEGLAMNEPDAAKQDIHQETPVLQSSISPLVEVSSASSPHDEPHVSYPCISAYVTREVLERHGGKIKKRMEFVMDDYTEIDDIVPISLALEALDGRSTPSPAGVTTPIAGEEAPYESEREAELPIIISDLISQSQERPTSVPTSKIAIKRFQFKKLVPAESVIQYLSDPASFSHEELYHRTSQVASILKDLQDEHDLIEVQIKEHDAYVKAQLKVAKEAERIVDEQRILEDEPELMKVLQEYEEVLRQREKGWKVSLEQIQKTGLQEADPPKYTRLLRLKAEPKLMKDIAEKLAKSQQPEHDRQYISLKNPRQTMEAHKSDRPMKRIRLENPTKWDDRKMMDAYGLPYSSAEGRVGDQFLPDQTKVDENGELVYENGRPKRSRAKRQIYDTEPSGAPSPEKGEEVLPAKRRRIVRKHEDVENGDDSSRPQTPAGKKLGALGKVLGAKKLPGGKAAKGSPAKCLKARQLAAKTSGLKPAFGEESDDEEHTLETPVPEEDNSELGGVATGDLEHETRAGDAEEGNGEPVQEPAITKKRIGRPPKGKPRKKPGRRAAKIEDDGIESSLEKVEEHNLDSEEEEDDTRISHAQSQELEESVRAMMEAPHATSSAKPAIALKAKGKGGRAKKRTVTDTNADGDALQSEEVSGKSKKKAVGKSKAGNNFYYGGENGGEPLPTTEQNYESIVASASVSVSASTSRPTTASSRVTQSQSRAPSYQNTFPPAQAATASKKGGKRKLQIGKEDVNDGVTSNDPQPISPKKRKYNFKNKNLEVHHTESDAIEVAAPYGDDLFPNQYQQYLQEGGRPSSFVESVSQDLDEYWRSPAVLNTISGGPPDQEPAAAKPRAKRTSRPGKRKTAAQTAALEADMKEADPEAFEVYKAKKEAKSKKLSESATARWKAGLMEGPMQKRARTNAAKAAAKKGGGAMTPSGFSAADNSGSEHGHGPPHVPFSEGVFQAAPQPPVIQTQTLAAATRNSRRPRKPTGKIASGKGTEEEKVKPRLLQQMSAYDQFQALSAPGSPMVLEKRRSKKVIPTQMDEEEEEDDDDDDYV